MTMQTEMNATFAEGREAQFREMMEQLAALQAKYKGVRGELLAKVRDELMRLKPADGASSSVSPPASPPTAQASNSTAPPKTARPSPPEGLLPSCRVCGRGMKRAEEEGTLICARGHTRLLT